VTNLIIGGAELLAFVLIKKRFRKIYGENKAQSCPSSAAVIDRHFLKKMQSRERTSFLHSSFALLISLSDAHL
jgi:hypothetical protein